MRRVIVVSDSVSVVKIENGAMIRFGEGSLTQRGMRAGAETLILLGREMEEFRSHYARALEQNPGSTFLVPSGMAYLTRTELKCVVCCLLC